MAQQGEDCYFFYNASCVKGLACPFRHQAAALGKDEVCAAFLAGSCTDVACSSRHTKKTKSDVPCFYETRPSGCRNVNCIFRHVRREQLDESLNVLPKLDLQAWTKPSVQFPAFLQQQATTDTPNIKLGKIVINTQEESDQESMNGSPVKQAVSVELKEDRVMAVAPTIVARGRRLLDSITSNPTHDKRVKINESERVKKINEMVADAEGIDAQKVDERAKIVSLMSGAVTHAVSNFASNEVILDVVKDSACLPDIGIDLGIKSLEQIQRQRAIESMKRHVHKRVVEPQDEPLQSAPVITAIRKDSPQRITARGDSSERGNGRGQGSQRGTERGNRTQRSTAIMGRLQRATSKEFSSEGSNSRGNSSQRSSSGAGSSSECSPPRFKTRKISEELSPKKIDLRTRNSPKRFMTKGAPQNVSRSRTVSRETEEISPRRFEDKDASDEDSLRRLKASLLQAISPRRVLAKDMSTRVASHSVAGRHKDEESPSRRVVVTRPNSSEDSDLNDERDKPSKPLAKITRPSAKARLGWNTPERSTKDKNITSLDERCVATKFKTRLGRDRNVEDDKTSKQDNANIYERSNNSRSKERSEVREHTRKRVKSPDVVRVQRSLSSDPSDSCSDRDQCPSPPLRSTSHTHRLNELDKLKDARLNKVQTTDTRPNIVQKADLRLNKIQTTDARHRITTKSNKHRHVEETRDDVVVAERSPVSKDHKKSVVPLAAITIPTRRIFVDDGSKTRDTEVRVGKDTSEDSFTRESLSRENIKKPLDADKTSDETRRIKSANVRRLQLERAKLATKLPQTTEPTVEVHVKLTDNVMVADSVMDRTRVTTGSSTSSIRVTTGSSTSSPAIVIRTLAEIKREKEEKRRKDGTESSESGSRKRRHAVVDIYRPPSLLLKESLTESLREKRSLKQYNDVSRYSNDEPKVDKHKTRVSVRSNDKPTNNVDVKKSAVRDKEQDWSNVRSYAEIMADKKRKLEQATNEPTSPIPKRTKSSDEASADPVNNTRKPLESDRVLPLVHSTSTGSFPSIKTETSQFDSQQQKFKRVVFDTNTLTNIRIPSRPFARKRLKTDAVVKSSEINEVGHTSEEKKRDSNDLLNKHSKNVEKVNVDKANTDNETSMDVENRFSVGDSNRTEMLTGNVNSVETSEPRAQPLTSRRRTSKMSNSESGIVGENVNKSGRRLTSTEGDLLPDPDDIFSDSFLSDLTQYPAPDTAAIDDDDDFLQEMKVLLS